MIGYKNDWKVKDNLKNVFEQSLDQLKILLGCSGETLHLIFDLLSGSPFRVFRISPWEKYWDAFYALDWGISFDEDRVQLIADTLGVKSVAIENFRNTWIYTYGVSQMAQELVQKLCDDVIGGFPAMFNSMKELVSTISSGNIKANSSKIKVIVINFSISLLTFI